MTKNYKFFNHKECEFFPCHDVENNDKFNCLFCYCPLYSVENCGGNNSYINCVKDCSNCMIPHSEDGYDYIFKKLIEINKEKKKSKIEVCIK